MHKDQQIESLTTQYKPINFNATEIELWNRSVQGKTIGIRIQSMLPQINIPPRIVEILATVARQRRVGVCTAYKYSPTHFLSLYSSDFQWADLSALPKADYLLYIKPTTVTKITDHLSHEEKLLDNFLNSLEKVISRQQKIEILDLCRTLILVAKDKISQKLLIKGEILFPYINFLFTPIQATKLVSSSFTKQLIQGTESEFLNGFLTMDQGSRVVPLEREDKMAFRYPIIGIWVKGVPQTNMSNKTFNLVHPLVFAACAQFIITQSVKEKISPNKETCSFLFIDFSAKPKFYEVACQRPPTWRTTFYEKEVNLQTENFPCIMVNFLKEDTKRVLKQSVSDTLPYISKSTCNSRSGTPPSAKPPVHRPQTHSSQEIESPKNYKNVIEEQNKLIEKLQAQVTKLQNQVMSPKPRNLTSEKYRNKELNLFNN